MSSLMVACAVSAKTIQGDDREAVHKPHHGRSKRGGLENMSDMPLDILFEVRLEKACALE